MNQLLRRNPLTRAVWCVLLLAGCGSGSSEQSFVPAGDAARDALTRVLTAWQSAQGEPGKLELTNPAVNFADPAWRDGARLASFEITNASDGDGRREFTVRRTLEGESAPVEVIYVVVGKDPLWVMLKDEYDRQSEM